MFCSSEAANLMLKKNGVNSSELYIFTIVMVTCRCPASIRAEHWPCRVRCE